MKKELKEQLKQKDLKDLVEEVKKVNKEIFDLRMSKETGKLKNLRSLFLKRKELAVIKTIISQKKWEK
jgi:ribosomal protein L29